MDDIITLLKGDHQAAEALLNRFETVAPSGRDEYFCEVVHLLVGHEVAEELVVYPAVRKDGSVGEQEAEKRIAEQAEAEQLLAEMESDDATTTAFAAKFIQLRESVLAHAQAEETSTFPLLQSATNAEEHRDLGVRYQKAKEKAPTHPHPHAPDTPPGNKVLGPIAALLDRARDAMHKD